MDTQFEKRFEYFVERTEADLKEINRKLDSLWSFRALLLGLAMAVSSIITVSLNVVLAYFEYKR